MVLSRRRAAALGAWLVATLLGAFRPSGAAQAPTPARLAELQARCDAAWRVKITARDGVFEVSRPRLDSLGVRLPVSSMPLALVTIGDVKEPERRIPWAGIERLHTERSRAMAGLGIGFAVGAALSLAALGTNGPDISSPGDGGVVYAGAVFTLLTSGLGLLLGMSNPALQPIYP